MWMRRSKGIKRNLLAERVKLRLQEALTDYRLDHSPRVLLRNSLYALGASVVVFGLYLGLRKGLHGLDRIVARQLQTRLRALEARSARFIRAQQLARLPRSLLKVIYALLLALSLYFYLRTESRPRHLGLMHLGCRSPRLASGEGGGRPGGCILRGARPGDAATGLTPPRPQEQDPRSILPTSGEAIAGARCR